MLHWAAICGGSARIGRGVRGMWQWHAHLRLGMQIGADVYVGLLFELGERSRRIHGDGSILGALQSAGVRRSGKNEEHHGCQRWRIAPPCAT